VKDTTKIAIKILQGSAVTQNALDGLLYTTILQLSQCTFVKNYENRLRYVKVYVKVMSEKGKRAFLLYIH